MLKVVLKYCALERIKFGCNIYTKNIRNSRKEAYELIFFTKPCWEMLYWAENLPAYRIENKRGR